MATGAFEATEPKPRPKRKKSPTNSLTAQISHYVSMCGGYAMRINVGGFYREDVGYIKSGSTVGVPDLICVQNGRLIGVEVKTGRDWQKEEQKEVEERIKQAKGVYIIARDFDTFRAEFDAIIRGL
ncbi:MAG TPA: hypothetical protein DCM71_12355 [Runella sp.]|nr:hypothetical protein [Runella sp.]